MGSDKALLKINHRTIADIITQRLYTLTHDVWIVRRSDQAKISLKHAQVTYDYHEGDGPLAGLESGLTHCKYDWSLCLAVDTPSLKLPLLQYLIAKKQMVEDHADAIVCVLDGQVYPLLALYNKSVLPVVSDMLAQGDRKVRTLLSKIRVEYVHEIEWHAYDPAGESFRMMNTPDDFSRISSLISEQKGDS